MNQRLRTAGLWLAAAGIGFLLDAWAVRAGLHLGAGRGALDRLTSAANAASFLILCFLFVRWSGKGWLASALFSFVVLWGFGTWAAVSLVADQGGSGLRDLLRADPGYPTKAFVSLLAALLGARLGVREPADS